MTVLPNKGQLPLLLITSDLAARARILEHISRLQLFAVDTALDSNEAITKLRTNNYRFIISDINIGDVDAWCLSSLLRSDIYQCDRKTPIVLLTDTYSEKIAEATAKSFGINAVLAKSDTSKVNEILADALSISLPLNSKLQSLVIVSEPELSNEFSHISQDKFVNEIVDNAKDGLALVRQKQFDFIVIDTALDNEAAMPLLQTIQHENPTLPVIILVPRGDFQTAELFMLNGASDFIYVPYNPSRIINICERAVRRNTPSVTLVA